MPGREDWSSLARSADEAELREHILTGSKAGKPFTPYVPTIPLPAPIDAVLDFGCGIGRNFPYLRTIARRIVGFDLPPMIERCRALASETADALTDDWNTLRSSRFDLLFASLVLQHVETATCREYLRDFAHMAPATYLLTRTDTDFGANVLELVAETGAFAAGSCVEVEHDPATHQLKVLGTKSFDAARASSASVHCEVLLRSAYRSPTK